MLAKVDCNNPTSGVKVSGYATEKFVQLWMLQPGLKNRDFRCTSTSRIIEVVKICCNSSSGRNLQFRLGLVTLKLNLCSDVKRKVISSFCFNDFPKLSAFLILTEFIILGL